MKCQRLYHQPNSAVNHQPANLILMWSLSPAIYHQLMLLSLCGHYSSPNPPPFGSPFRSRFPALGITSYGNIIASNQTLDPLNSAISCCTQWSRVFANGEMAIIFMDSHSLAVLPWLGFGEIICGFFVYLLNNAEGIEMKIQISFALAAESKTFPAYNG